MSRWFRHYAGMMRDEKFVRIAIRLKQPIERVLWVWGAILESAAEIDEQGRFDIDAEEISHFLRVKVSQISAIIAALTDAGRIDEGVVCKWGTRQFSSDSSKTRVAAYRQRKRFGNVTGNDDVTLQKRDGNAPETETETETYNPPTPLGDGKEYAFSGHVIRLNSKDLEKLRKTYNAILDIEAELSSIDAWWTSQPMDRRARWFHSTAGMLNKRHQEAKKSSVGPQPMIGL